MSWRKVLAKSEKYTDKFKPFKTENKQDLINRAEFTGNKFPSKSGDPAKVELNDWHRENSQGKKDRNVEHKSQNSAVLNDKVKREDFNSQKTSNWRNTLIKKAEVSFRQKSDGEVQIDVTTPEGGNTLPTSPDMGTPLENPDEEQDEEENIKKGNLRASLKRRAKQSSKFNWRQDSPEKIYFVCERTNLRGPWATDFKKVRATSAIEAIKKIINWGELDEEETIEDEGFVQYLNKSEEDEASWSEDPGDHIVAAARTKNRALILTKEIEDGEDYDDDDDDDDDMLYASQKDWRQKLGASEPDVNFKRKPDGTFELNVTHPRPEPSDNNLPILDTTPKSPSLPQDQLGNSALSTSSQKKLLWKKITPKKERPYNGGAGPSKGQVNNNNKALAEALDNAHIPYKISKLSEYLNIGEPEDEQVLKITNSDNEVIFIGYDRWGYVIDKQEGNALGDQVSLSEALDIIKQFMGKMASKKTASSKEEINYILGLLTKIAPTYKDPEDVPAVTPQAAEIIANWYNEEGEDVLSLSARFLKNDLLELKDAATNIREIKTVWPKFIFSSQKTASDCTKVDKEWIIKEAKKGNDTYQLIGRECEKYAAIFIEKKPQGLFQRVAAKRKRSNVIDSEKIEKNGTTWPENINRGLWETKFDEFINGK